MESNWVIYNINTNKFWSAETGPSCALIFTHEIAKARRMTRRVARRDANRMGEGIEAVDVADAIADRRAACVVAGQ